MIGYSNDPRTPYPQANKLAKVILVPAIIGRDNTHAKDIAKGLGMSFRQGQYYGDALVFLGLAIKVRMNVYRLTTTGLDYLASTKKQQKTMLIGLVCSLPDAQFAANGSLASVLESRGMSRATAKRRSETIRMWVDTCLSGDL